MESKEYILKMQEHFNLEWKTCCPLFLLLKEIGKGGKEEELFAKSLGYICF